PKYLERSLVGTALQLQPCGPLERTNLPRAMLDQTLVDHYGGSWVGKLFFFDSSPLQENRHGVLRRARAPLEQPALIVGAVVVQGTTANDRLEACLVIRATVGFDDSPKGLRRVDAIQLVRGEDNGFGNGELVLDFSVLNRF